MKIPYNDIWQLLNEFYTPFELNEFIKNNVSDDIFNASLVFAKDKEDYCYLACMDRDRNKHNNESLFFIGQGLQFPIVLTKGYDMTLAEFAILHDKSTIHVSHFEKVVAKVSVSNGKNENEKISEFNGWVHIFDNSEKKELPK